MNNTTLRSARTSVAPFALGLACASWLSACTTDYPLGQLSRANLLVGEESTGAVAGDATVPARLGAPEVTLAVVGNRPNPPLAAAGDLDGDGYDDMVVAEVDPATGVQFAHVRYGGPRPNTPEDALAFAESGALLIAPDEIGHIYSLLGAGDVDADGYADFLLRTVDCTPSSPADGAYLVYGSPERLSGVVPLASVSSHFRSGERATRPGGRGCSGSRPPIAAGDIDGDGFADLVLSHSLDFDDAHRLYLFYGRAERFASELSLTDPDAEVRSAERLVAHAAGDINGDGFADVFMGDPNWQLSRGIFLVAGSARRLAGSVELELAGQRLEGAYSVAHPGFSREVPAADLDGDGLNEALLRDSVGDIYLFYGAPGSFDAGFDFSQAAARLAPDTLVSAFSAGDRDGDGDDELADQFARQLDGLRYRNVALASGSRERISGTLSFPEDEVVAGGTPYPGELPSRQLSEAVPAGDLDGDGAADLFTLSADFGFPSTGTVTAPLIHIHYGTPAPLATPVR
jgi:hypothetical protein